MPQIRPVSDLRNNFAEISRAVHENSEPVILTKNGYGDMVVISYEEYQKTQYDRMITSELQAAQSESETAEERHAHPAVMAELREKLKGMKERHV